MATQRRALRNGRNACRTGTVCTAAVALAVSLLLAWLEPSVGLAAPMDDDVEHIGPLRVSVSGRARVRGGRPDDASIHLAWAPMVADPDRAHRQALSAFERASFPPGVPPHKTIIDQPPQAWMRRLEPPDLPVRWNKRTVEYLGYFRDDPKGRLMMRAWMRRAGRYEDRLRRILRDVGVPEDLVYVALAESGFNPRVRSRVGAAGLWQFMEGTGEVYGLRHGYWVDERFDIERSTHAAALYLKDLRVRFGSWELALAAYNAGYGLVMTSLQRHNTNNFWALCEIESGLPYATTNYVPKIIAAALVGRNRETFGVSAAQIDPYPAIDWVEVRLPQSTSLEKLAEAIEVDPDLVAELNAHLVRKRTPPRRGRYPVRIPRDKLDAFQQAHERLRAAWSSETIHTVRHGETLASIAGRFGLSERDLRRLNGVQDAAEVTGGVVLVVPAPRAPTQAASEGSSLTVETPPDAPPPPIAAVPALRPGPGRKLVFFETTRGTTPRTVEEAFGVRFSEIVAWNDLDPHARLQAGQILQVVVDADFDADAQGVLVYGPDEVVHVVRGSAEHIETALARRGLLRRGYTVRKADNLRKIGRRFDLSLGDLARINGFSRSYEPKAGELIVIYVPKTRLRHTVDPPATRGTETAGIPVVSAPIRRPSTPTTNRVPGRRRPTPSRSPSTPATARVPGQGS